MAARLGCYTGARASGGRVWHAERHAQRLVRDARLLELGDVDAGLVLRLLAELAAPTRLTGDLKIRVEARRGAQGAPRLRGSAVALEPDRAAWRAIAAPMPHPGPSPISAAKVTERAHYEAALAVAQRADAEEALLFDATGFLVEGARTNVVVVLADGRLATPPLARGGQAGVAREILLEQCPELGELDVPRESLAHAREVIVANAVRGARPLLAIDDRPVGNGRPGPWSDRLGRVLLSC